MPAPAFTCDDELEAKIEEYLAEQRAAERPISKLGFAVFCGVYKEVVYDYASGVYDNLEIEGFNFSRALRKLTDISELDLRDGALLGKRKERMAMGLLAQNYGYSYAPTSQVSDQSKQVYIAYVGEPEALEDQSEDVEFEEIEFVD